MSPHANAASHCVSFYAISIAAIGTSFALGVGYERSPDYLRYNKPVFFGDNAFARWNDLYLPVLLSGCFVTSNWVDYLRNSAELGVVLFPVAREFGTTFAVLVYLAGGAASTITWKLQCHLNPDRLATKYDRNAGSSGAICGLSGCLLAGPSTFSLSKRSFIPAWPVASLIVAERVVNEYVMPKLEPLDKSHPLIHQWGCLGGAIFGAITGYTALRRRSGVHMKSVFERNMRMSQTRTP
ncbi:hypothetical protein DIPPA_19187 [Diplonema papillatum]|nr:hypothetical protein DIPPA_19187 [Diplonema papillatum]